MKKGPLGKTEVFYIKHHYKLMSLEDLCKELDRAKSLVNSCIEKCKKEEDASTPLNASNLFVKNNKGSVIMTENASSLSDDLKKSKVKRNSLQKKERFTKIK